MGSPWGVEYEEPDYQPQDYSAEIAAAEARNARPKFPVRRKVVIPPRDPGPMDRLVGSNNPSTWRDSKAHEVAMNDARLAEQEYRDQIAQMNYEQAERRMNAPAERQRPDHQITETEDESGNPMFETWDKNSATPPKFRGRPRAKQFPPDRSRTIDEGLIEKMGPEGAMRFKTNEGIRGQRPFQPRAPSRKVPMANSQGVMGFGNPDDSSWEPIAGGEGMTRPGGPPKAERPVESDNTYQTMAAEMAADGSISETEARALKAYKQQIEGTGPRARREAIEAGGAPQSAPAEQTFAPGRTLRDTVTGETFKTDANGRRIR